MFETLSSRLSDVFDRLKRKGRLSEADVATALREVRIALLEADVALPVVKTFVDGVKERAVGAEVVRSVTPAQMVVKIVHDRLVDLLGGDAEALRIATAPAAVLMVGLQGSGKTTTSAKLAARLSTREKKRVLLASLDTRRPAAQEQLAILADQAQVASLPVVFGQGAVAIAERAMATARREGYDVVILDTAGRLQIDEELMAEAAAVRAAVRPSEVLLVADALTGQEAVNVARTFHERLGVSGIVLTRMDGDARGGAALSMRHVTGQPIKLVGVGEKLDALEAFHPERVASRILGMVEKAVETIDRDEAEKLARRMQQGNFSLDDYAKQLQQIGKLGGMKGMLGLLPGVARIKNQLADSNVDEAILKRQSAIIGSMTRTERRNVKLLNASRKRRVAAGSGTSVQEINRLVRQYQQMADMMKRMKKMGGPQKMFGRGMPMPPGLMPPR
jgi:signal recognition particle subunit SRP54